MHGEKEKIKCKWICGTLNSWARFRGLVFTVIQKHIKKNNYPKSWISCKEPVEQTGVTTQRQDRRATQRSETKRKIVKCLPNFTPDYCFTAENSTQIFELPVQGFKYITFFVLTKQQQFQAKLSRTCQVWWWWCKGQVIFNSLDYLNNKLGGQECLPYAG